MGKTAYIYTCGYVEKNDDIEPQGKQVYTHIYMRVRLCVHVYTRGYVEENDDIEPQGKKVYTRICIWVRLCTGIYIWVRRRK